MVSKLSVAACTCSCVRACVSDATLLGVCINLSSLRAASAQVAAEAAVTNPAAPGRDFPNGDLLNFDAFVQMNENRNPVI